MSQAEKKRPFRTFLFWIHLTVGSIAGIVILVMSVTGVLLMYERQLIELIDGHPRVEPPSLGARHLGPDALLAASGLAPAEINGLTISSDPAEPATVRRADRSVVYVDPYTGVVLPAPKATIAPFFRKVTEWHRYIALQGDSRPVGKAITGVANLGFLFLVLSGFYLWWPRRWSRKAVRAVTVFNARLGGKARDFNWHNSVGFWCAPILALVVASGAFISYQWPRKALDSAFGESAPSERSAGTRAPRAAGERSAGEGRDKRRPPLSLDASWARAEQQLAGWKTIGITGMPAQGDTAVRFSITTGIGRRPTERTQLALNPVTGAVLTWQPYDGLSTNRKIQAWTRWIHTGEAVGLVGQTLAGLASAGAALLVWTGLALALRRFRAWRIPSRRTEPVPEEPSPEREAQPAG